MNANRTAHPTDTDPQVPDDFPLVGRRDELARLESQLDLEIRSAGHTARGVVFLRGEGGVGKSRLARELAVRAQARGWHVARGRAYPVESGIPYAIFADAWLPVFRSMESNTLAVLTRGGEAELRYLFPALGERPEELRDAAAAEPEEFRTRLLWNFAEFVKRYAARTPLFLLLEDLQWADESSLELLHFLARQLKGENVVILGTYNDMDRDRRPGLMQTERSLVNIGAANVVRLDPLTKDDVTELVSKVFRLAPDVIREFSAVVFRWSRGNAFFVEEILRAMVDSGRLRVESGAWIGWEATDFGMPASIRDAILARVQQFDEDTRKVLEMSAVVGTRVSFGVLEAISGLDASTVLGAVEGLTRAGLLDERAEGTEIVYDFRHPLVRQTLYDEFGLQRARIMHGVVAEAMEAHYGDRAPDHADELAFHFARTDGGRLRDKAARYLVTAGRHTLGRRADAEAIAYLEAAMERAETSGSDGILNEVVPLLARARTHVGNFDEAERLWQSALERMPALDPGRPAVLRALGMTNVWQGRHEHAAARFGEGLVEARRHGNEAQVVRLLIAKAHGLHELGKGAEALAVLQEALPLATELGDAVLLARVHRALALLYVWVGPPAKAVEHGERAIGLSDETGDLSVAFWARWGLAVLAGMRGDTVAMMRIVEEINALADEARIPMLRLWTADMAVEHAWGSGDWDAGVAKGEQAIALARSLNQRTLLPRLLVWTSQFYVARGQLEKGEELVREAVEMSGIDDPERTHDIHQTVPTYIGLAHYLVHLGDFEDAIEAARKGLAIAEGTGYTLWAMHQLLPILAEACLWAGRIDEAEEVGIQMRELSERIDHRLGKAWADGCDSLVRWKRGDAAGAVDQMLRAADELEAVPMVWPAARLRRQLAGRLHELGRTEEGLEQLRRVHAACVSLRAGLELEKTRAMFREMERRPPSVSTADGPLGLTDAELKVALLVAEGMSNGHIAETLRCSVRTVSTHLSNIYGKLEIGGAGARMRLGNLVREAGLLG